MSVRIAADNRAAWQLIAAGFWADPGEAVPATRMKTSDAHEKKGPSITAPFPSSAAFAVMLPVGLADFIWLLRYGQKRLASTI